jgi:hypothetical protein
MWLTVVVGVAALLLGFAVGRMPRPFRMKGVQPAVKTGQPPAQEGPGDQPAPDGPGGAAERARLVVTCADLADRLRDRQPALYTTLTRELAAVGVTVRLADGEPFDAEQHNPVGTESTRDPGADLRVAETVRVGVVDHGSLVRVPDVIVYRCLEDGHGG